MNQTWWVSKKELDQDQQDVIKLPLGGSHLILGPPGSGKSNLLLLRASYQAAAGEPNIAIVVFTRTLKEFIASGAKNYAFSAQKVFTSAGLFRRILFDQGLKAPQLAGFDEQRDAVLGMMKKLVASKSVVGTFAAVYLDEAQDYLPGEVEVFAALGKTIFAVADSRQKITTQANPLEALKAMGATVQTLKYHYRNGRQISRLADALRKDATYPPMVDTCQYDERARPATVEVVIADSMEDQAVAIVEKVRIQLKAYPEELIGVIAPRNEDAMFLWQQLGGSDIASEVQYLKGESGIEFGGGTRVCVGTVNAAKGLEFRAVHLAAADKFRAAPLQRERFFTAVTRAKTSLSIYHSLEPIGFIEEALGSLSAPPNLPELDSLFVAEKKK